MEHWLDRFCKALTTFFFNCLHHLKEVDHLVGHIGHLDLLGGHKVKVYHHRKLHFFQQGHLLDHHQVIGHLFLLHHLLQLPSFQSMAANKRNNHLVLYA